MSSESKSFLRQIYPEEGEAESAEVDLVAVHGLDPVGKPGHAYNTWTYRNNKDDEGDKLWLRDFLPAHPRMPKTRVLLYGYNSSAVFKASTVGVAGAASNLLDQLRYKRLGRQNRPIVFVCHSLGGIVVKQALIEAHNADEIHGATLHATKGIAFFGTPHRGGHGAKLGDAIVQVLRALTGNVRNDIMESLRTDSFLSNHLQQNFARRAKNLRVVNFIETLPITEIPALKHYGLVVPRTSSALGWSEPHEVQVLMEASHTTICKFRSEGDELYIRVADHMLELLVWATQPVVPMPSILTEQADPGPPPSYTSLIASSSKILPEALQHRRADSDNSMEGDSSHDDELPNGWLSRIRAVSPFRSPSPTPATRSQKSPWNEPSLAEKATFTWPIVMLPYQQNPSYINRSEIWQKIVGVMNQGTPIVLNGVGGSGKTQTAIHLTYWFRERNPDASIMWVHAGSSESCLTGMQLIASRIGIQSSDNRHSRLIALKDYLEHPKSGHWVLIFDSADDVTVYDAVSEFIPRCVHGQVVVTSRRRLPIKSPNAGEFIFGLSTLTPSEAVSVVRASLRADLLANVDAADLNQLLRELGFLPLAIAQAVAFMNKNFVSVAFYLAKISDDALLSEQMSRNYIEENYISGVSPPIYATWKTSFERLRIETPQAGKLLGFLSFLDAKMIPIDLVQAFYLDGADFGAALVHLEEYSFAELSEDGTSLSLHRFLQVATQKWLEETAQMAGSRKHVLFTLSQYFPDAAFVTKWPQCEAWLAHAVKFLRSMEGEDEERLAEFGTSASVVSNASSHSQTEISLIATLNTKIGFYYHQLGEYATARAYLEEAVDASRQYLGTMHDLTLASQEKLVDTLRYLGHLRQAATNARDLKRARKAKLGRKHRDTLVSYRLYSHCLHELGNWTAAMDASDKALRGYKELYRNDPSHLDVLRSCRRAAVCCIELGQYDRAEALLTEALQGYQKRSEGESVDAAESLYARARLRGDMGHFVQSETDARKCHEIRKRIMRKDHPIVLKAYWVVGTALQGQMQWEPAQEIFQQLLAVAAATPGFGKTHYYSYTLGYSLATLREGWAEEDNAILGAGAGQQKLFEARAMLEDVLAGRTNVLGPDHSDTLATRARLASVNGKVGNFHDSEKESQEVLKIVTSKMYRRLGVASARIAWTCLASLRRCAIDRAEKLKGLPEKEKQLQDEYKLACRYARDVLEGRERMLGQNQQYTIAAAMDYAESLELVGDEKMAQKIRQRFKSIGSGLDPDRGRRSYPRKRF